MDESLKAEIVSGAFWNSIATVIETLTSLGTIAFLARLLDPKDFGVVAVAAIAIGFFSNFSDIGFEAAIIQRQKDIDEAASTGFFIVIGLCLTNYILLFLFSKQIASFYGDPIIESIVKVLAAGLVIGSFTRMHNFLLSKEMQFRKKALCEIVPSLIYSSCSIPLAFYGFGVWSIVYGEVAKYVCRAFLLLYVTPWRPMFKFDLKIAKELVGYGKHAMFNNVFKFGSGNMDNALIGKFMGLTNLSFYKMSYNGAAMASGVLYNIIGRVTIPAFSKAQGERSALRKLYCDVLEYSSYLFVPAFVGLFLLANEFVLLLYGPKWQSAIPMFRALLLFGVARVIGMFSENVFLAAGNPSVLPKITLLKIGIVLGLIFSVLHLGLLAFCVSISILEVALVLLQFLLLRRHYGIGMVSNLNCLRASFLMSFVMAIGIVISGNWIVVHFCNSIFYSAGVKIAIGVVIYLFLLRIFRKKIIFQLANVKFRKVYENLVRG